MKINCKQNIYILFSATIKKRQKKLDANVTRCSQAVTHPSTNRAQRCLTSVIGRELFFFFFLINLFIITVHIAQIYM